jgi:hypothetical protein
MSDCKLNLKKVSLIDDSEWSDFVSEIYKRPYNFQQQEGCRERGVYPFSVPISNPFDYKNSKIPETTSTNQEGVSFEAWLSRDPSLKLKSKIDNDPLSLNMWWHRSFYPFVDMIVDDLYKRGLLEEGEYIIDIDW